MAKMVALAAVGDGTEELVVLELQTKDLLVVLEKRQWSLPLPQEVVVVQER
jgi:hypothetical protein